MHEVGPKSPIYEMDVVGTLQSKSGSTITQGQQVGYTWTDTYPNVRSKRLPPLRGKETFEADQAVGIEQNSFLIRAHDRTVTQTMRYLIGTDAHYIRSVRFYKGDKNWLVLDTEKRDNQ